MGASTEPTSSDAPTRAALTSVVVVSHDSGDWLHACVNSVLAQDAELELIVVDNASRDGALDRLPSDTRLTLIRNRDNRGFGPACNQGATLARGAQLLFLNPDCELPPGAIARLHEMTAGDTQLAIVGAQLTNADGSPQAAARRQTPTPLRAFRRALGLGGDGVEMPAVAVASATTSSLESVEAVSGALMWMPRDAFSRLGGFDERYTLHCEDLDLCRRALDAGFGVAVASDLRVVHHKGRSSQARPLWVEWQKHRGMLRYFRKFDAAASPWWLRLLVPIGVWLRFPLAAARAWAQSRQR